MQEIRRLARAKAQTGITSNAADKDMVYRATLLRWRREVSCVLQQGNAAILMAAAGSTTSAKQLQDSTEFCRDLVPDTN